jgi:hypothetical protein
MSVQEPPFEIEKPADNCLLCGKSLADEEKHPSVLANEANQHIRKDYCRECWRKIKDKEYFCFWLAKRLKPAPGKREAKRKTRTILHNLYNDLSQKSSDDYSAHLFILAHLLMRLKVFRWEATLKDEAGNQLLRFYDTVNDQAILLRAPSISDEKLAALRNEIFSLLE